MAELVNGRLQPSRMLVIRFLEGDATVQGIVGKVQDALGVYDPLVLTDGQGNELLDSEGTRGSFYWKQNARKILAVQEGQFSEMRSGRRRRSTRTEDATTSLQDAYEKIEEVVLAAQSLPDVTESLEKLARVATEAKRIITDDQAHCIREAFSCCVCKGPVVDPMLGTCCRAILGCKACLTRSLQTSADCVRCRAGNLAANLVEVSGLSEALKALEGITRVD
ncbi:uncharacterized protein LOC134446953 [Engraulis encrasicolus]|uniref:uncharacterized protein LOC134446953 n=1 Tax=Engraulis encrasicolus TaxID=184585 RepID=UPI002FD44085